MRPNCAFAVYYLISWSATLDICENAQVLNDNNSSSTETPLSKLVELFSKAGAFRRMDSILGEENSIEETSSCPPGNEGLDCRRSEARRAVDCPRGDCYCHNCAAAGAEWWPSCCRDLWRCCSHLAAACRTCDHPTLHPFCSSHFNKCRSSSPPPA